MAQLEAMSGNAPDELGIARVQRALGHPNNYLVAKAAKIVSEHGITALLPDVLNAFDRFFVDPVKSDPQCLAKNALASALVRLECQDPQVYLRGLRHHQEEPVWGGQSDTAGALRGTCALALVTCPGLGADELLNILLEPLVDLDKTVRIEAVRAIGQVGGSAAQLLLKLRVMLRREEPEVLGACFSALLKMDQTGSIPLVASFLDDGEEAAAESAFALAETHDPVALEALVARRRRGADTWFASALDNAIALTRLPEAVDFLIGVIERDSRWAVSALEAISRVYTSPEVLERVTAAVTKSRNERLEQAMQQLSSERSRG
jgi:HEAT repeat protein